MATLDLNGLTLEQKYEAAGKYAGIPAQIFPGMWATESANGTKLTSPKGARGHFQTMPKTQATLEARAGRKFDPDNFDDSLTMAAMVMRENIGKFKTIPDALRAYNAGWDRSTWGNAETSEYVGKVFKHGGVASLGGLTNMENQMRHVGTADDPATFRSGYAGRGIDSEVFMAAYRGDPLGDMGASGRGGRDSKPRLSNFEKGVRDRAAAETAAAMMGEVGALEAIATARAAVTNNAPVAAQVFTDAHAAVEPTPVTGKLAMADAEAGMKAALEQEEYRQSLGVLDYWGSHFDRTLGATFVNWLDKESGDAYPEGWVYPAEIEKDFPEWHERQQLRTSTNDLDIRRNIDDIIQQRENSRVQATMGFWGNTFWGLGAEITDPTGWAVGLGVGKVASMGKWGARMLAAEGKIGSALVSAGAEGAAGAALSLKARDAMGQYVTPEDWMMELGGSVLMSGMFAAPGLWKDARIADTARVLENAGAEAAMKRAAAVQASVGPNATQAQFNQAWMQHLTNEEIAWAHATLGNVEDKERLFARPDAGSEAQPGVNYSIFPDEAARDAFIAARGWDQIVPSKNMRELMAEVAHRAEQNYGHLYIDPEKLKTMLSVVGQEATATRLLASRSQTLRGVALAMAEDPTGAGGRRSNAAISRESHFQQYMGNTTANYQALFSLWAGEQKIGKLRQILDGSHYRAFNREVQLEMNARELGLPDRGSHPAVVRAADMYGEGYHRMGRDQKFVGTAGAQAIDLGKKGYWSRTWNLQAFRELSFNPVKHRAVVGSIEDQLRNVNGFTDSKTFSVRALAVQYVSRLEHRASSGTLVGSDLMNASAKGVLKDALESLGLPEVEVARHLRRFEFEAGDGKSHTKHRMTMDYSREYTDANGGTFRLVDLLEHDMDKLYRRYAARTAGDVAMAKYGFTSPDHIEATRTAARLEGATESELQAFDQFIAEMTGQGFGNDPLWMQNVRTATSLLRLGGAVFPQMGVFFDSVAGLGIARAFKLAGGFNRYRKQVQALARGEKVNDPILGSFEGIGPEFGAAEYRLHGLFDTGDVHADIANAETIGMGTKLLRSASNIQRSITGHRWVVAAQSRGIADQIARRAWRYVREGMESNALKDMGINDELRKGMLSIMDKVATFDKNGELMGLDVSKLSPDDVASRRTFVQFVGTVHRGTNQIMNNTFAGESGKWAHDGWMKMMLQFRTVSMTAQQKSFSRIRHVHGNAKLVGLIVGGAAAAVPIHMARVHLKAALMSGSDRDKYIDEQLHPFVLARATANYLTSVGLGADLVEAASGAASGWADAFGMELPTGLRPTGGRQMRDQNFIGGQVAPGLGVVNDAVKGIMGNPGALSRSFPGNSIWYAQPALMGMRSALEED